MAPPSNRTGHFSNVSVIVTGHIFLTKIREKYKMKKLLATLLVVMPLTAFAEEVTKPSITVGAERELEAEVNVLYGSVGYGITSVGITAEDTAIDSGQFNIQKYEVDFNQPVGPVTVYMKNDFDDGFKHTETVVGAKITF
jgi:hypothetical protein